MRPHWYTLLILHFYVDPTVWPDCRVICLISGPFTTMANSIVPSGKISPNLVTHINDGKSLSQIKKDNTLLKEKPENSPHTRLDIHPWYHYNFCIRWRWNYFHIFDIDLGRKLSGAAACCFYFFNVNLSFEGINLFFTYPLRTYLLI